MLPDNGDGTFQTAITYDAGSTPASVAVGNLNGDGRPDLAVTNFFSNNASVLLTDRRQAADSDKVVWNMSPEWRPAVLRALRRSACSRTTRRIRRGFRVRFWNPSRWRTSY